MKPIELYEGDVVIRDGNEAVVTGIKRLRPSKDHYKKLGAERYLIDFTSGGIVSGRSYWSDEDIYGTSWPEGHVSEEDHFTAYLKSLRRDYVCGGCGTEVRVNPGYDEMTNFFYAETCAACPNCDEVTDFPDDNNE
jgi:hypothetical protein